MVGKSKISRSYHILWVLHHSPPCLVRFVFFGFLAHEVFIALIILLVVLRNCKCCRQKEESKSLSEMKSHPTETTLRELKNTSWSIEAWHLGNNPKHTETWDDIQSWTHKTSQNTIYIYIVKDGISDFMTSCYPPYISALFFFFKK